VSQEGRATPVDAPPVADVAPPGQDSRRDRELPPAEALGVWKRFGSTQALRDVSLRLDRGRCLGLVGRNGAGKSTLVSIMSGLELPDRGSVQFEGQRAPSHNDRTGWARRISTVYQHSMVVPWLTVAENVFLGRYPRTWYGRVDWRAMRAGTREVMAEWGLELDERELCARISVEQRQVVEIARALASGSRCLLLDEPTSALERTAVRRLFDRIRGLLRAGVAILYISHHLEEVFEVCDEVAVIRDGEIVLSAKTGELDESRLVAAMVGGLAATSSTGDPTFDRTTPASGAGSVSGGVSAVSEAVRETAGSSSGAKPTVPTREARLVFKDVSADDPTGGPVAGVSFEVRGGERLGVIGLRGSGAMTIGRVAAGAAAYSSGSVLADGRRLQPGRPDKALMLGVGYVPEDRRTDGFVPLLGVAENASMNLWRRLGRFGVMPRSTVRNVARPVTESLAVVSAGMEQPVAELSGGNQQKVTVARALVVAPGILAAICPTRGVDVASKALLLEALVSFTDGTAAALLLASDELDDLVICHRVIVIVQGQVFAELTEPPFDTEERRGEIISLSEGLLVGAEPST
jgi:simple sugar transport system ATP-binding protein